MAGTTTTNVSNALKTVYLPKAREQLQMLVPLYDVIPKTSDGVEGNSITLQLRTGFNEGIAAISEGGALPTAGYTGWAQATIPTREIVGRGMISTKAVHAARSKKGAVEKILTSEMDGLVKNFAHNLNRQMHGDGYGVLARVDQATPSTSLQTDAAYGVANDSTGDQLIRKNMRLDLYSATSAGTQRTGVAVVSGVSKTAAGVTTVTIDALPTGTADNDYIFRAGSRGIEMVGLLGAIDADAATSTYRQTYLSINRNTAGNSYFDANFLDNAGEGARALSEVLMQNSCDLADIKGSGNITHIVCDHLQLRKFQALVQADRRFVTQGSMKIAGGRKEKPVPTFNDIPMIIDKHAVGGFMQFMDRSSFKLYLMNEDGPDWMDLDGEILSRVPGYAAYEFTLYLLGDLACDRPNSNTTLRDLQLS